MQMLQQVGELAWRVFQSVNTRLAEGPSVNPGWAPGALPKSHERTRPPLGYPRETDSLCPRCVIDTRKRILSGERDLSDLVNGHLGEIKATFYQKGRELWVTKNCPDHGTFDDLRSIDIEFDHVIERRYPGRDFRTLGDAAVHRHGTSSVRYGRGAVLTVDLTNRCNMMCNPCFMDANQVGYVHELTFDDVKKILDDSISFKPRRQMVVQYSGGEPTMSPHFLEACAYAKKVGYRLIQAATNGLRFAIEPEFAFQAKEAGLDMVYLQFDGTTNESNAHRHITNLFDVREVAIDNLAAAGIKITPVVTIVNGVNNHQVGPIFDYCLANHDKMGGPAFQPVSFTGRDEEVSDEARLRQRYTTSHLAHEFARYYDGRIDPYRDWYPLGSATALAALADHMQGPEADFGQLSCGCHPNCGAATMMVANARTKQWATVMSFFDLERFFRDLDVIVDSARGKALTVTQLGLSFLRNFDEKKAPSGLTPLGDAPAVRQQDGRRCGRPAAEAEERLAHHLDPEHVVPGPLELRLPKDRDVRDPLRHPGGRDLLLRLQHRSGLAEHHRGDAPGGEHPGLVRAEGPAPDLRREPSHPAAEGPQAPAAGGGRRGRQRPRERPRRGGGAAAGLRHRVRLRPLSRSAITDRG